MTAQERIDKGLYWDRAWSLVEGCSPVSPGCAHCWSEKQTHIRSAQQNEKIQARYSDLTDSQGKWTGKIRLMRKDLDKPLHVKKPTTWSIWNDLLHEEVWFDFIGLVLDVIYKTPQHTYYLLTKRAKRMKRAIEYYNGRYDTLPNLRLGVTAENQETADERVVVLCQTPAAFRFVSVEPMLGSVVLENTYETPRDVNIAFDKARSSGGRVHARSYLSHSTNGIDLVVVGGETLVGARPMKPAWPLSLRDQCLSSDTDFFFKSWGEYVDLANMPQETVDRMMPVSSGKTFKRDGYPEMYRVGKKNSGHLLGGREWRELPI